MPFSLICALFELCRGIVHIMVRSAYVIYKMLVYIRYDWSFRSLRKGPWQRLARRAWKDLEARSQPLPVPSHRAPPHSLPRRKREAAGRRSFRPRGAK